MVSSPARSALSPLQASVLAAFFARERGFYLTGGGALAGFHLGHRVTSDLDLFTLDDAAFERGRFVLADVAAALGGSLGVVQHAPGFLRVIVSRGDDGLVVDLVRERAPQLQPDKPEIGGVRVDPIDEILANKLRALVSRCEERDLVDVWFLERAGHAVEAALPAALAKDGGCTPGQLAWVLSQVAVPDGVVLPAAVDAGELRAYLADLVRRLRRAALPG